MITDGTLQARIIKIHSTLTADDFHPVTGTIELQNDSDGKGDYVKKWEHSSLSEPTESAIKAVTL